MKKFILVTTVSICCNTGWTQSNFSFGPQLGFQSWNKQFVEYGIYAEKTFNSYAQIVEIGFEDNWNANKNGFRISLEGVAFEFYSITLNYISYSSENERISVFRPEIGLHYPIQTSWGTYYHVFKYGYNFSSEKDLSMINSHVFRMGIRLPINQFFR